MPAQWPSVGGDVGPLFYPNRGKSTVLTTIDKITVPNPEQMDKTVTKNDTFKRNSVTECIAWPATPLLFCLIKQASNREKTYLVWPHFLRRTYLLPLPRHVKFFILTSTPRPSRSSPGSYYTYTPAACIQIYPQRSRCGVSRWSTRRFGPADRMSRSPGRGRTLVGGSRKSTGCGFNSIWWVVGLGEKAVVVVVVLRV